MKCVCSHSEMLVYCVVTCLWALGSHLKIWGVFLLMAAITDTVEGGSFLSTPNFFPPSLNSCINLFFSPYKQKTLLPISICNVCMEKHLCCRLIFRMDNSSLEH